MRNAATSTIDVIINKEYKASGLDVDSFITEQITRLGAFDIEYLRDAHGDKYASFHVVYKRHILTIYYWESRDEWFCKA